MLWRLHQWLKSQSSQSDSLGSSDEHKRPFAFRLNFVRFYELSYIILLSLFCNLLANIEATTALFTYKAVALVCLLASSLYVFEVSAALNEKKSQALLVNSNKYVDNYYSSFDFSDVCYLYLCLFLGLMFFILFVILFN